MRKLKTKEEIKLELNANLKELTLEEKVEKLKKFVLADRWAIQNNQAAIYAIKKKLGLI